MAYRTPLGFFFALLAVLPTWGKSGGRQDGPPPARPSELTLGEVRALLSDFEFGKASRQTLVGLGEKAFTALETVLSDAGSDRDHIVRTLIVLREVKADRKRFLEASVRRLASADGDIRREAVELVGQIGSEHDTAPVVALLFDRRTDVAAAAAQALSRVGGRRDLVALHVWLMTSAEHVDQELRRQVQQSRDGLAKRLPGGGGEPNRR